MHVVIAGIKELRSPGAAQAVSSNPGAASSMPITAQRVSGVSRATTSPPSTTATRWQIALASTRLSVVRTIVGLRSRFNRWSVSQIPGGRPRPARFVGSARRGRTGG